MGDATLWAWDYTNGRWIKVAVNSDGELVVDVE